MTDPGGADPSGDGLQGLRRRVGALDGRLTVESTDPGGRVVEPIRASGTTVRAEIPYE